MSWTSEIYFSIVLKAGGPESEWLYGWVLVRALFLAGRWPRSYCVLTWQRCGEHPSFPWWICSSIPSGRYHAYHLNKYSVCSVMSVSLRPHELQPTRLLSPWDFPRKNTGVGCHFLFQGIFLTQGSKLVSLESPAMAGRFFSTEPPEKPPITSSNSHYVSFHFQIPSHCRVEAQLIEFGFGWMHGHWVRNIISLVLKYNLHPYCS